MSNKSLEITLEFILKKNSEFCENFKLNPLMVLVQSDKIKDKNIRMRLLDGIQIISNYFQKTIMLRHVFCEEPSFFDISKTHLLEEFGHDLSLMQDRNNRKMIWDPILEATASWFAWKMFSLDNEGKMILIHLVLESSANIFLKKAHEFMSQYKETSYYEIHADIDDEHESMGIELLKNLPKKKYEILLEIQRQGWDIINVCCKRVAILSQVCDS